MTRYAIGDIQGCKASLDRLLEVIAFTPSRDELWLVGDLVNRGPRSLEVLRWARAMDSAITCVLGNHDLHLLARAAGVAAPRKRDTLDDVLSARDRGSLIDWLRTRQLVHIDPTPHSLFGSAVRPGEAGAFDAATLLVHAGLHPEWTSSDARSYASEIEHELSGPTWQSFLAATSDTRSPAPPWSARLTSAPRWRAILSYLVRARMLTRDGNVVGDFAGAPADAPAKTVPWFAMTDRAWATHTVVFGHWAALGLSIGDHHIGLDTGCVWGGHLTAIRLDDRSVFQVPAVETT